MSASTDTSFQEFQEDFGFPFPFATDEEIEALIERKRNALRDALRPVELIGNTPDADPPRDKKSPRHKTCRSDVLREERNKVRKQEEWATD